MWGDCLCVTKLALMGPKAVPWAPRDRPTLGAPAPPAPPTPEAGPGGKVTSAPGWGLARISVALGEGMREGSSEGDGGEGTIILETNFQRRMT